MDSLAVFHNPFSTATTNPKIPDGKCYHSVGMRLQAVKEFTNDTTGNMDFVLFPGINNGLCALDTAEELAMPYTNHAIMVGGDQESSSQIAQWRVVSQGLKLTLTNNSDENDGWWEAIRIQLVGPAADQGLVINEDGIVSCTTGGVTPSVNLVEHPTYCTGKLRDIHRHVFELMPCGSDHDFSPLLLTGNNVGALVDNENYDAVFIRIHGRGGGSPTRIMAHVVCNQELLYQEHTPLARYHSESDNNASIFSASKRKRQNGQHKAAKRQRTQLVAYG